jgi:hypothetical protein
MLLLATFQQWVKKSPQPSLHNSLEPIMKTTWGSAAALQLAAVHHKCLACH